MLGSALFAVVCGVLAISFVAARGGLQMPVAPTRPAVAIASPGATVAPSPAGQPTSAPATGPAIGPSPAPTPAPPTPPASVAPSGGPPTLDPSDPLRALPPCPELPGCFEYTIRRGDSLTGVASRYAIPVLTVLALNPEITDPRVVVVGHILYLGRDPFVRLPACPGVPDCSLYTVKPGDRLSTIAGRFGITLAAILVANPSITDPSRIFSGQVIHLPHAAA